MWPNFFRIGLMCKNDTSRGNSKCSDSLHRHRWTVTPERLWCSQLQQFDHTRVWPFQVPQPEPKQIVIMVINDLDLHRQQEVLCHPLLLNIMASLAFMKGPYSRHLTTNGKLSFDWNARVAWTCRPLWMNSTRLTCMHLKTPRVFVWNILRTSSMSSSSSGAVDAIPAEIDYHKVVQFDFIGSLETRSWRACNWGMWLEAMPYMIPSVRSELWQTSVDALWSFHASDCSLASLPALQMRMSIGPVWSTISCMPDMQLSWDKTSICTILTPAAAKSCIASNLHRKPTPPSGRVPVNVRPRSRGFLGQTCDMTVANAPVPAQTTLDIFGTDDSFIWSLKECTQHNDGVSISCHLTNMLKTDAKCDWISVHTTAVIVIRSRGGGHLLAAAKTLYACLEASVCCANWVASAFPSPEEPPTITTVFMMNLLLPKHAEGVRDAACVLSSPTKISQSVAKKSCHVGQTMLHQ